MWRDESHPFLRHGDGRDLTLTTKTLACVVSILSMTLFTSCQEFEVIASLNDWGIPCGCDEGADLAFSQKEVPTRAAR